MKKLVLLASAFLITQSAVFAAQAKVKPLKEKDSEVNIICKSYYAKSKFRINVFKPGKLARKADGKIDLFKSLLPSNQLKFEYTNGAGVLEDIYNLKSFGNPQPRNERETGIVFTAKSSTNLNSNFGFNLYLYIGTSKDGTKIDTVETKSDLDRFELGIQECKLVNIK